MSSAAARNVPRARGHWLLGHAREMRERAHSFPAEIAAQLGGIAEFRILHRRLIAIADPDLIRQVLVTRHERYERSFHYRTSQQVVGKGLLTTDGAFWKKRRRQVQPAFRPEAVRRILPAVLQSADEMFGRWEQARRHGATVPLVSEMQRFTLTVISRALLSVGIESAEARHFAEAVRASLYLVRRRNNSMCPMPRWVPDRTNRELRDVRDVLDAFVTRHLRPRFDGKAAPRDDIAQALLEARDPETEEPLSWPALLDETKTLFAAGFETTATMLAWALHELSHDSAAAERWCKETDAVLGGRAPAWDDLCRLVYADQIVQETLRLHPPVYTSARVCIADDELGGFSIPRGSTVLLSIYGAHRDAAFWPDPLRFDPARFEPGRAWPRHAFLPFITGKHTCIGNTFAAAEATLALALVAQRYRLVPTIERAIAVRPQVTLVPAREIPVRLEPR